MKQELVRWWQRQKRRLETSPLVTVWMGVNSSRDDLYMPLVYAARREEQDASKTAEQGQNVQHKSGRD